MKNKKEYINIGIVYQAKKKCCISQEESDKKTTVMIKF